MKLNVLSQSAVSSNNNAKSKVQTSRGGIVVKTSIKAGMGGLVAR